MISASHSLLEMLGGGHLLLLWAAHHVCTMSGQKFCYSINATDRDRLLSLDSLTSLTGSEKSLWCVVHALSLSGVKNITAVQALNHCLSNLFICEVNKQSLKDKKSPNYLRSYSVSRLRRSLEVAVGDMDDDYDDRVAERMWVQLLPSTKCNTCDLHVSDFHHNQHFKLHRTKCNADNAESQRQSDA